MFNNFLKSLSILKKFLFINLIIFIIIGSLTVLYLQTVRPNLILKKTVNHIQVINNTIDHISRLNIKFEEEDIRKFLFSTRFLFQNLDRVILFDNQLNLVGGTKARYSTEEWAKSVLFWQKYASLNPVNLIDED